MNESAESPLVCPLVARYPVPVPSPYLTRQQATALREQAQRHAAWLGKLIYRCRELQMWEHEPILAAASRAAIALADLDRELQRQIVSPHGDLKEQDGRKPGELRRA